MVFEEQVKNLLKEEIDSNEKVDFYFIGENLGNIINKTFTTSFAPISGVDSTKWTVKTLVAFTNEVVYIINLNDLGKKVDSFKFAVESIKNITYYDNKDKAAIKITFKDYELVLKPKKNNLDEAIKYLENRFNVDRVNEEFKNGKSKYLNILTSTNLIIAVTAIIIFIIVYAVKR